ncbi:MAG: ECF transporter S component [Clostridia bacterium]|nr:ECF transporter S component [Clostridia bacterium]
MRRMDLHRMVITAVLLAVGMVLPFLTGQIPALGQLISPLHIPALICGLTCGPVWGALLGAVLPLLRSAVFGMPPLMPTGLAMAFELATYGLVSGLLYPVMLRLLRGRRLGGMLAALIIAMAAGRIVGGAAQAVILGFSGKTYSFSAFIAAYFTGTLAGAAIHLIVIPVIVLALEKAKVVPAKAQA